MCTNPHLTYHTTILSSIYTIVLKLCKPINTTKTKTIMTIKTISTTAPTRCPSCSSQSRRPQCSRPSAPRGSSPCSARSRNHRRFHLGSETDFISRKYQMKFQGNTIKEIVSFIAKICNCQNFILWDGTIFCMHKYLLNFFKPV